MPQLQLTPEQQTQLLIELAEAADPASEALCAAIAAGAPEITAGLLALLRDVAESRVPMPPEDRAAWQALYRAAQARAVLDS